MKSPIWTDIIADMLQRGQTYASIGRAIGTTEGAVRAMMKNIGQQPRWNTGDRLIKLHSKVMRKRSNACGEPGLTGESKD